MGFSKGVQMHLVMWVNCTNETILLKIQRDLQKRAQPLANSDLIVGT